MVAEAATGVKRAASKSKPDKAEAPLRQALSNVEASEAAIQE